MDSSRLPGVFSCRVRSATSGEWLGFTPRLTYGAPLRSVEWKGHSRHPKQVFPPAHLGDLASRGLPPALPRTGRFRSGARRRSRKPHQRANRRRTGLPERRGVPALAVMTRPMKRPAGPSFRAPASPASIPPSSGTGGSKTSALLDDLCASKGPCAGALLPLRSLISQQRWLKNITRRSPHSPPTEVA